MFNNELRSADDSQQIYVYKDNYYVDDEYRTVWRHGNNFETYQPNKLDSGEWELAYQWYYNINHRNENSIKFNEFLTHFTSILSENQNTLGTHLVQDINYGVGGTIKEFNGGFDTLVSSMFVNSITPNEVIEFAGRQYREALEFINQRFREDILSYILNTSYSNYDQLSDVLTTNLIAKYENNSKYDQWLGDSSSYNDSTEIGLKNWIASPVQFGLSSLFKPHIVKDLKLGIYEVFQHDGKRNRIKNDITFREKIFTQLSKNVNIFVSQIIADDSDAFPTQINSRDVTTGDLVLRTNISNNTRILFRYSSSLVWEEVDLIDLILNVYFEIENRLYERCLELNIPEVDYNLSAVKNISGYSDAILQRLNAYTKEKNISDPFLNNTIFDRNNPFTWNYFYSVINSSPIDGNESDVSCGTWQALYEKFYGTPYPHIEPWVLQGYSNKPDWWDTQYIDNTKVRVWKAEMWSNILDGIVPVNKLLPDGTTLSTGTAGEITDTFIYLPVNIDSSDTLDGYSPDQLLPPFWNSLNSPIPQVRSLYDPNAGDTVSGINLNYAFGQLGKTEWEWETSNFKIYDELIVAFRLDPMNFLHKSIGQEYDYISCLEISKEFKKVYSHNDIIFHGDISDNVLYQSLGLNQWYINFNRYFEIDGEAFGFRNLWKDWDVNLSYLFAAFIDTSNVNISSKLFDITNKDYEISIKQEEGDTVSETSGLNAKLISVPSRFSRVRDTGIGWTIQVNNFSPISQNLVHKITTYTVITRQTLLSYLNMTLLKSV